MAWAVLLYTLVFVCLYIALDILIPSPLRKRRTRPDPDMAYEQEGEWARRVDVVPQLQNVASVPEDGENAHRVPS